MNSQCILSQDRAQKWEMTIRTSHTSANDIWSADQDAGSRQESETLSNSKCFFKAAGRPINPLLVASQHQRGGML
jgi:hypothetical protein